MVRVRAQMIRDQLGRMSEDDVKEYRDMVDAHKSKLQDFKFVYDVFHGRTVMTI